MLKACLDYLLGDGQKLLAQLDYAPLPPASTAGRGPAQQDHFVSGGELGDQSSDGLIDVSTVTQADPARAAGPPARCPQRRPLGDRGFRLLALAAGLLVLVILVLIAYSTTQEAWPAFSHEGLRLLHRRLDPATGKFGALAFIYGTPSCRSSPSCSRCRSASASRCSLTEVAPRRLRRPIVYVIDLLAAVPSVVFGLWGVLVLAP